MYKIKEQEVYYNTDNPVEVVDMMRKDCFIYSEDNKDFMEKATVRFYNWDRTMINPTSEERFIEDLLNNNYLTKLKNEKE